jgi:membrane-associated phospholipid phosphatase
MANVQHASSPPALGHGLPVERPRRDRSVGLSTRPLATAGSLALLAFMSLTPMAWHTARLGRLDRWVLDAGLPTHTVLFDLGRVLSAMGSGAMVTIITVRLVYLLWARTRRPWLAAGAVGAIAGSAILELIAKQVIGRPRPSTSKLTGLSGYGFPSGHTSTATALAATCVVLILIGVWSTPTTRQRHFAVGLAVLYVCGVAAGRMMVGAHFLTDTIAGVALGTLAACAALAAALVGEAGRGKRTHPSVTGRR